MKTVHVDFRKQTNIGMVHAPVALDEVEVGEVVRLAQLGDNGTVFGGVVVSIHDGVATFQVTWDGKKTR